MAEANKRLQPLQVVAGDGHEQHRRPILGNSHPAGAHPEYRDHRPHRRGQDHRDRADPLLHQEDLQDRRGARGRRHHGLDGAGAGAGDHHHRRRHDLLLGRSSHQLDRHARPRGFYGRGGAQPARARRRGRRVRRRGRRGAAVRDGLAAGRPLSRAALLLRQQAGPHRRRLLAGGRHDQGSPGRQRGAAADPDRHRGQVPRRDRPDQHEGDHLRQRPGRPDRGRRDPGRAGRGGRAPGARR